MPPTPRSITLDDLAAALAANAGASRRVVALAGAPGSGKSTTAELLQRALTETHGIATQIVPMDGFHYDDAVLAQLGRSDRKGAPDTFDVIGLKTTLTRLAPAFQTEPVAVPVFDRGLELSRAAGRLIDPATRLVLVEGNYLLLNDQPWSQLQPLFDLTIMLDSDAQILRKRLLTRWRDLEYSLADAQHKVDGNDLPNARRVLADSSAPDYFLIHADGGRLAGDAKRPTAFKGKTT